MGIQCSYDVNQTYRMHFMCQHSSHNHSCFLCCLVLQGTITNMLDENVVQPMLVTSSAITLATETVRMLLKIDDIVPVR